MIANTNDGTSRLPRLRIDINGSNVFGLPTYSTAPRGEARAVLEAVKAAGFEGVQTNSKAQLCREVGLRVTASGRINTPHEADLRAAEAKQLGADCCTVHVGWGIEDDDQVDHLVEATLRASEKHGIPIYIETHRATITQDMWRTVRLVERFPEIRFNGDFSHYYTGQEMVYGDMNAKLDFLSPVFEHVRFIHGRIGNSCCMQVDIGDGPNDRAGGKDRPFVDHFKEMWTRSFAGFLRSAKPGDYICFTPELLGPEINYARTFPSVKGELIEESDRWQQAILYGQIARACWDEATRRVGHTTF
jgi:hypothetical protein